MTLGNVGAAVECRASIEASKNIKLKTENGETITIS